MPGICHLIGSASSAVWADVVEVASRNHISGSRHRDISSMLAAVGVRPPIDVGRDVGGVLRGEDVLVG